MKFPQHSDIVFPFRYYTHIFVSTYYEPIHWVAKARAFHCEYQLCPLYISRNCLIDWKQFFYALLEKVYNLNSLENKNILFKWDSIFQQTKQKNNQSIYILSLKITTTTRLVVTDTQPFSPIITKYIHRTLAIKTKTVLYFTKENNKKKNYIAVVVVEQK